jgi:cell division protein ZapA (FtsZ GTPase activity inhibitor)
MAQTVKVTIMGTEYPLRSNDEALTKELAAALDTDMHELQAKLPAQSTTTLAVLSALNFAEQSANSRASEVRELSRVTEELNVLSERLEKAMDEK